MKVFDVRILFACGLIMLLSIYHFKITGLSVTTLNGFLFELILIALFLTGVEYGRLLNNNDNKNEEDAEE
jgi:hypothetical protein